jgi:DNA-directed RNA polymerase specialized sigma24 family protein
MIACSRRAVMLRVHRRRLRREDLEDCYSQATLELLAHVRAGGSYASRQHIANALELRFLSRARDRRRALSGRSPIQAALEQAETLSGAGGHGIDIVDRGVAVDAQVILRDELRRIGRLVQLLSVDQRRVLSSQLGGESCAELCERCGWSREKYRKVAQRARARRIALIADSDVPHRAPASDRNAGPIYEITSLT